VSFAKYWLILHDQPLQILRPLYPGQFHNVKLNMWNIIFAVDLSRTSAMNTIGGAINNIISRNFPFRFGVVPLCETEDGTSC
jgi:UDP-glucose:glycoprotein glucosyltransferase